MSSNCYTVIRWMVTVYGLRFTVDSFGDSDQRSSEVDEKA
jgi:hypothetical protein